MTTILIADQQEIVRQGVKMIISNLPEKYHVLEASTCAEVTELLASGNIQYMILDIFLSDGNILSTLSHLMDNKRTSILIYSIINEKVYARRLMQRAVRGFVSKESSLSELEKAIRYFLDGNIYLNQAMLEYLLLPPDADLLINPIYSLSDKELEVVEYVVRGMDLKEIAGKMSRTITTVSTHRRQAYRKLGVQNVIELRDKFLLYKLPQ